MQAGGALDSAIGGYYGAKAQKINMLGSAEIQDLNADLAERAAQQELAKGNAEVAAVTARAGQLKSKQRVSMAANGVDLSGGGSLAEVLTSTDLAKENDVNTITTNAVRAAWGLRAEATNMSNDANAKRAGVESISPFMAANSSLLGSAGSIASSWYSLNKTGAK
jgi:hypothetical protein